MTIEQLRERLKKFADLGRDCNVEAAHWEADQLLIEFINDKEVEKWFDAIEKWYA